jgi:hypothetical protein
MVFINPFSINYQYQTAIRMILFHNVHKPQCLQPQSGFFTLRVTCHAVARISRLTAHGLHEMISLLFS